MFSSLARSLYFSLFSLSSIFTLWSGGTAKSTIRQVFFFCWLLERLFVWSRLGDPFVSQNPREYCASHSPGRVLSCAYATWSYSRILISCTIQLDRLPYLITLSLTLFCDNLLHSLFMWLIVLFLSQHNLHLLFCCVTSNFALTWVVIMALFSAVISRKNYLKLCDANGFLNSGWRAGLLWINQNKRTFHLVDIAFPPDHRLKI